MTTRLALLGVVALAGMLLMENQLQAAGPGPAPKAPPPAMNQAMCNQAAHRPRIVDDNCGPTRPFGPTRMQVLNQMYYNMAMAQIQASSYYVPPPPPPPQQNNYSQSSQSTSSSTSYDRPSRNQFNNINQPQQQQPPRQVNDAPAEPANRLLFIELEVSGLQSSADRQMLTHKLEKLKGSRGATVKVKAGGSGDATVKVWYSEKEPVETDAVVEAVSKLGFTVAKN